MAAQAYAPHAWNSTGAMLDWCRPATPSQDDGPQAVSEAQPASALEPRIRRRRCSAETRLHELGPRAPAVGPAPRRSASARSAPIGFCVSRSSTSRRSASYSPMSCRRLQCRRRFWRSGSELPLCMESGTSRPTEVSETHGPGHYVLRPSAQLRQETRASASMDV
jgi:hypothetical protein